MSLLCRLHRILDGLDGSEFDVVELTISRLDWAVILVLHDVARFRVNGNRTTRAFPAHAFHGSDQGFAMDFPAGLLQRLVVRGLAAIAGDRRVVRAPAVGRLK